MKRVLVTGASGFLGTPLTQRLTAAGAEVHAVSRAVRRSSEGVQWWQADVCNGPAVERLVAGVRPDVVFHLAGHVTGAPDLSGVLPAYDGLLTSTVHVLTAAAHVGVERVVLAGSLVEPETLTDGTTPGSPYAAAKWAASVYGRMFHELYDVPVVYTRLGYAYGPRQPRNRVVAYAIAALLRGESPRLTDGAACFDWVYVDDVVGGLIAAAATPKAVGRAVDLGSGELRSVRELVEQLVRVVGTDIEPSFGDIPNRPGQRFRAAAVERTRELLGWHPETSLTEGLQQTVDWHRARGRRADIVGSRTGGSECEC